MQTIRSHEFPWIESILLGSLPLAGGAVVARMIQKERDGPWYKKLAKPEWQPPDWLFPVVWTLLYVMLGVVFVIGVKARNANPLVTWALAVFIIQLVFNYAWSIMFFEWHSLPWSVVVIWVLLALVLALVVLFYLALGSTPALLLLPYLAWIAFATTLNMKLASMNPQ